MTTVKIISSITSPEKYVGFADIPNQIHRHCVMHGFDFNLMVVGESGLGKSTFINNLFTTDIYTNVCYEEKTPPIISKTIEITTSELTIVEKGVTLRLKLIDCPGFGDNVDNSACWNVIENYINARYDDYIKWEGSPSRTQIRDMRVHACIYFIAPTGHRLKPLDIEFLKHLHDKVNIIPVIAKSDTLSHVDLMQFKIRVMDDIKVNGIKIYDFPDISPRDDEERETVKSYLNRIPFGVVSSNSFVEINGKTVRCRKYPWGICEIENLQHCDFIAFRDLLIRTGVCHLIKVTDSDLYEKYRSTILGDPSGQSTDGTPLESLEFERVKQSERLETARREMEKLYISKKNEFKLKIEELEKEFKAKAAEENENKRTALEQPTTLNASNTAIDKNVATHTMSSDALKQDDHKKKDKKKKLF